MDLTFTDEEAAFAAEARAWLAEHLEVPAPFEHIEDEIAWGRTWQAELAAGRWVGIHWPSEFGGRGASPLHVAIFNTEYARARAPQPVNRVGINLAGPTLLAHGTDEQKQRWIGPILTAEEIWCQLFSEPDAGSDLAGLRTTATPVEGGWILNGQKVWTSYAQFARWGICLARTDVDAPKHRGISYLVVDMTEPGIEIRPLVQVTGEAEFNEVFLTDVFVPADHLVGGLNQGWAVANTTLAHERGTNFPFKEQVVHEMFLQELVELAVERGVLDDPEVADGLAQAFVALRVLRLHNWRTLSRLGRGIEPGAESSWVKLAWTDMTQLLAEVALRVQGAEAPLADRWARQWLWSGAASIAGGTSEVQRTIIGERILGLPRGLIAGWAGTRSFVRTTTTVLDERFAGPSLDRDVWLPAYLPHWSSRGNAAATWEIGADGLHLTIPVAQARWCPDQHVEPLRVSAVQTGSFAGSFGSTVGQQPFRDGVVVLEEQPTMWGYTPHFGRVEVRMRMSISPRSMAAFWLAGIEDRPERSGEICVAEVFGDAVHAGGAEVGMGVHQFRDPRLREEFATEPLAIDVAEPHTYGVDWRDGSTVVHVDGTVVRRLGQAPDYPMQLMIGVFDFPAKAVAGEAVPVPELVVERVTGRPLDGSDRPGR